MEQINKNALNVVKRVQILQRKIKHCMAKWPSNLNWQPVRHLGEPVSLRTERMFEFFWVLKGARPKGRSLGPSTGGFHPTQWRPGERGTIHKV
jgi:hypothetical protein